MNIPKYAAGHDGKLQHSNIVFNDNYLGSCKYGTSVADCAFTSLLFRRDDESALKLDRHEAAVSYVAHLPRSPSNVMS